MGRRAKPAALKEAQGNPGHRKIAREPKLNRKRLAIFANAVKIAVKAAAQDEGVKAYAQVEASLRAMNFIRQSDETLLLRYRRGWMRWWNASIELTFGSEVYECAMTGGVGTMLRVNPWFLVEERLEKRLLSMEDRLGASPMARQTYLQRVMSAGSQPALPGMPPADDKTEPGDHADTEPPPPDANPVGMLNRNALN